MQQRPETTRQLTIVPRDAPAAIHETERFACRRHADRERLPRWGVRDIGFVVRAEVGLEPTRLHRRQGAIPPQRIERLVHRRQQHRVALTRRHGGVFGRQRLRHQRQIRVLLRNLQGARKRRHHRIELSGADRGHGVHDVVERLDVGLRKTPEDDLFTNRAGHHADARGGGIVEGGDRGLGACARGGSQRQQGAEHAHRQRPRRPSSGGCQRVHHSRAHDDRYPLGCRVRCIPGNGRTHDG